MVRIVSPWLHTTIIIIVITIIMIIIIIAAKIYPNVSTSTQYTSFAAIRSIDLLRSSQHYVIVIMSCRV